MTGADILRAVEATTPLINPRLADIDWDDVAAALAVTLAAAPAPLDVSRLARALRPMCDCIRSDSDAEAWARDIAAAYQADEP